jgi:hypothetical protein
MNKKLVKLTILSSILAAISACSNSGSSGSSSGNNTGNGDVDSLQIITPKIIYSKPNVAGFSYVTINNPTSTIVKNLHYNVTNEVGSGSGSSVDSTSAASCASIAAYSQCNIKVMVAPGAVAGSLRLDINNNNSNLGDKLAKSSSSSLSIGIEQAAYNDLSGADGITLSYYHTVINGVPYIMVSGLVASDKVGSFNKVVLVNSSGVEIPNQEAIGVIGSARGSTFNILLPVPAGVNSSQTIKVQTQQVTNDQAVVVSTATASSTLTTKEGIGIAEMLPSAIYLTESNPEQIITFSNNGDAIAQLQQLISNNSNIEVVFNPSSLASGTITTATLKLRDKTVPAATGDVTLVYNNSQSQTSTSATVGQNLNPTPGPTPSDPVAGLTAIFAGNDNDFFTTTAIGIVSKQLTLTNTGNTNENGVILTLPANFTISAGSNNSCEVTQGTSPATISNSLTPEGNTGSCDITVMYTNNAIVDPAQTDQITINYNYNNGTPAPEVNQSVEYKVDPASANLVLKTPSSPYMFMNSLIDGTETIEQQLFTIENIGDEDASDISIAVNDMGTNIFSRYTSEVSASCGVSLAKKEECNIGVQFGPIPDNTSAGTKSGNLIITYKKYPSAISSVTLTPAPSFFGQVATSGSAIFNAPTIGAASGFTDNDWTNLTIDQNTTTGVVTYGITNSATAQKGDDATDFYLDSIVPPIGWTVAPYQTGDCPQGVENAISIPRGASCNIRLNPDTSSSGYLSATILDLTLNWKDQASNKNIEKMQIDTPAVTVTALPTPSRVIFLTTKVYSGLMGGIGGFRMADAECKDAAARGKLTSTLTGTWKALLAGNDATIKGVIYTKLDSTVIATATGGDLVGYGVLEAAIDMTENGDTPITNKYAWTGGLGGRGTIKANCNNWGSSSPSVNGNVGEWGTTANSWWYSSSIACSSQARLMCVQQ